ncbi:protein kinase domain-containing protein [Rhodopirellula baltica]|uniref:Protein containing Tyrosine protein kinase n=1 Tax=Rhodopirellula baltica SWK14 TaxID=993516 RepID=L7CNL2_RHOBT|nr:protein kinase [Rhodopirellula baltica]ELP34651.1 protein containing Tyrosine protein kinase [Rhodopirellula baltica SWK14]
MKVDRSTWRYTDRLSDEEADQLDKYIHSIRDCTDESLPPLVEVIEANCVSSRRDVKLAWLERLLVVEIEAGVYAHSNWLFSSAIKERHPSLKAEIDKVTHYLGDYNIVPERLGDFRLILPLQGGAQAKVAVAIENFLPEPLYVVKYVSRRSRPMQAELLKKEYHALCRLRDNPHVLQPHKIGCDKDFQYLVTPYQEKMVKTELSKASAKESVSWLMQIAGAVQSAHAKQIYHRDLVLENVLLSASGAAILGDFGNAANQQSVHRIAPRARGGSGRTELVTKDEATAVRDSIEVTEFTAERSDVAALVNMMESVHRLSPALQAHRGTMRLLQPVAVMCWRRCVGKLKKDLSDNTLTASDFSKSLLVLQRRLSLLRQPGDLLGPVAVVFFMVCGLLGLYFWASRIKQEVVAAQALVRLENPGFVDVQACAESNDRMSMLNLKWWWGNPQSNFSGFAAMGDSGLAIVPEQSGIVTVLNLEDGKVKTRFGDNLDHDQAAVNDRFGTMLVKGQVKYSLSVFRTNEVLKIDLPKETPPKVRFDQNQYYIVSGIGEPDGVGYQHRLRRLYRTPLISARDGSMVAKQESVGFFVGTRPDGTIVHWDEEKRVISVSKVVPDAGLRTIHKRQFIGVDNAKLELFEGQVSADGSKLMLIFGAARRCIVVKLPSLDIEREFLVPIRKYRKSARGLVLPQLSEDGKVVLLPGAASLTSGTSSLEEHTLFDLETGEFALYPNKHVIPVPTQTLGPFGNNTINTLYLNKMLVVDNSKVGFRAQFRSFDLGAGETASRQRFAFVTNIPFSKDPLSSKECAMVGDLHANRTFVAALDVTGYPMEWRFDEKTQQVFCVTPNSIACFESLMDAQ